MSSGRGAAVAAAAPSRGSARGCRRHPVLTLVSTIAVLGTALGAAYHYFEGVYRGRGYPLDTFLFLPSDHLRDFLNEYVYARQYGTGSHFIVYTPVGHLVMRAADLVPAHAALAIALVVFVATLAAALWFVALRGVDDVALRLESLVALALFSYPVLFVVSRANMDGLVFVMLFWGLFLYWRGRTTAAALLLGVAAALKLYPAVFLLLLFSDRRYREALFGCCTALGVGLLATAVVAIDSGRGFTGVLADTFRTLIYGHGAGSLVGTDPIQHGNSLWGVYHLLSATLLYRDPGRTEAAAYVVGAAAVLALLVAWLLSGDGRRAPLWRKLAALTVVAIVLPTVSHDYKLILVYLPLVFLLEAGTCGRYELAAGLFMGLALIPFDYWLIEADVTSSVFYYPAVLLVLLGLAILGPGRLLPSRAAAPPALPHGDAAARSRRALTIVTTVVLAGTWLAAGSHYVRALWYGARYPDSTFLFIPRLHFSDFFTVYRDVARFHVGVSDTMAYSPFMHVVVSAFTLVPAGVAFVAVVVVFLAAVVAVVWRAGVAWPWPEQRLQQALFVGLLAYPVLFTLDRANLEMIVFVFLAAFFWLYYDRRSGWAWLPLAMAIAGKYYWAVFVVLLVSDRQYRQAVYACLGTVGLTLASILVLPLWSGFTPGGVVSALHHSLGRVMTGVAGTTIVADHGHGLWAVWVALRAHVAHPPASPQRVYLLLAGALFAYVVYHVVVTETAAWRKVTLLLVAALALPYQSQDYALIHVFFALALFCVAAPAGRRAWWTLALFSGLLVPLEFVRIEYWLSVSTFVYTGLLLALGVTVVVWGRAERLAPADERGSAAVGTTAVGMADHGLAAGRAALVRHREPLMYLVVGAWNTLFGYAVFALLYTLLRHRVHVDVVLVCSYAIGIVNNYVLYRWLVFRSSGSVLREFPRFSLVYLVTLAVNLVVLPLALHALPFSAYVVQAAYTVLVVVASYLANKYFSFAPGRPPRDQAAGAAANPPLRVSR